MRNRSLFQLLIFSFAVFLYSCSNTGNNNDALNLANQKLIGTDTIFLDSTMMCIIDKYTCPENVNVDNEKVLPWVTPKIDKDKLKKGNIYLWVDEQNSSIKELMVVKDVLDNPYL